MKTLHLTLKKKWFDMILKGEKTEEYREIKPFWENRLQRVDGMKFPDGEFRQYDQIEFKNGYAKNAPTMTVELKRIDIGYTKPEWCDEGEKQVYVLKLGKVLFHKNCNQ